jgi:hypothetical protein
MIGIGKVRLVTALEVRDVFPAELHQSPALQRVERLNDARAAKVNRPKAALFVTLFVNVLGVGRPAIVESSLRILSDVSDRRADAIWVPSVLDQPFMGMRLEEHPPRLEGTIGRK